MNMFEEIEKTKKELPKMKTIRDEVEDFNFNTALMLFIWFISFIICLFIFMLGHVILLLTDIKNRK